MGLDFIFCEIEVDTLELNMRLLFERHSICADEAQLRGVEREMKVIDQKLTRYYQLLELKQRNAALRKERTKFKRAPIRKGKDFT